MELRSLVNDGDASADAQDGGAGDSSTDTVLARERRVTRTQAARADMRTEYTGGRIPLIVFLVMLVAGAAFLAPGISLLVLFPASTPGSPFLVPLCLTNEGNLTFVSWNYTSDGVCSALSEASAREVSFVIDQSHIEGQRGYRTALLLSDRANASGTVRVTHDDVVLYQVSFESTSLVAQRLFVVGGAEVVVHVPIDTDFSGIPLSCEAQSDPSFESCAYEPFMSMSKYETEGGAWTLPESGVVKLTLTDVVVHGTTSAPPDFIIELEPEGSSVPQSRGMLLLVVGAFLVNCSFGLYSFLRNIAFVKVHIE